MRKDNIIKCIKKMIIAIILIIINIIIILGIDKIEHIKIV